MDIAEFREGDGHLTLYVGTCNLCDVTYNHCLRVSTTCRDITRGRKHIDAVALLTPSMQGCKNSVSI